MATGKCQVLNSPDYLTGGGRIRGGVRAVDAVGGARLIMAVALSRTTVILAFSSSMKDSELATPGNYAITPSGGGSVARTVSSVVTSGSDFLATLTLDGNMTPGTNNYSVAVTGVHDAQDAPISALNSATFSGFAAVTPAFLDSFVVARNQMVAVFSAPMLIADLEDESKYTLVPDVGSTARTVSSAIANASGLFVTLTLSGNLTPGVDNYRLDVDDTMTAQDSITLNPARDQDDFSGLSSTTPILAFVIAITPSTVLAFFNAPMATAGLEIEGNYTLVADVGSTARTVALAIADASGAFVTLTLSGPLTEGSSNYNLAVANLVSSDGVPINTGAASLDFSGPGSALTITSSQVAGKVRLTFSQAVLDNAALRNASAYHLSRSDNAAALTVLSVTPQAITNPTYVDLEIAEQQNGLSHNVSIDLLEHA